MNSSEFFAIDFDGAQPLSFNHGATAMLDPPLLHIYSAGPLTRNDTATEADCIAVRHAINRLFGAYEYCGVRFKIYDPATITHPGTSHSADEVYATDHSRTMTSDLVIFHVNVPSLGVGIEAQIAADATVPKVVVSKSGSPVSRMFSGLFSPAIACIEYENHDTLDDRLAEKLAVIAAGTVESAKRRRPILAKVVEVQTGKFVFRQRVRHGVSIQKLAQVTDIREFWLRRFERDPYLAASCTMLQLLRIGEAINSFVHVTPSQIPTLKASDEPLPADQNESLDNLFAFVTRTESWVADEKVFRLWDEYVGAERAAAEQASEFRAGNQRVLTADDWGRRYEQLGLF